MLKNIIKFCAAGCLVITVNTVFAMDIYTVEPNDYLYKISKTHSVKGISISQLTDSIKGINKAEIPGIVDNRIKVGDKIAIPTTKDEVEDGLTMAHNQIMDQSYNQPASAQHSSPSSSDVPTLIPGEDQTTSQTDLDSGIVGSDEISSSDGGGILETLWQIVKLVIYAAILFVLALFGKKIWDNKNNKKEQDLELLSKKKRDHLMSRISPVVSNSDFYKSQKNSQEEMDFTSSTSNVQISEPTINETLDIFDTVSGESLRNDESLSVALDDLYTAATHESARISAVKTNNGMIFETETNDNVNIVKNDIKEIAIEDDMEDDLQYVKELIEQYLDSEKYEEANMTIQDSLEHNPNNIELRYMLLEVYAKVKDEIAFDGEVHLIKSKNIVSMFDPLHQKIAKLKDKYFE